MPPLAADPPDVSLSASRLDWGSAVTEIVSSASQSSSRVAPTFPLLWTPTVIPMRRVLVALALVVTTTAVFAEAPQLVSAARQQTRTAVIYDGSYTRISYPMGDVPAGRGVCTDVVIRAYRAIGIDLQVLVHEDMRANFSSYPRLWGLRKPDTNVDHRRVPNLQKFFERAQAKVTGTDAATVYRPGDLVTWMLPGNLPHLGIVSDRRASDTGRPLVIHNIGAGPMEEDMLFAYPITGHYRYRVQ